MALAPGSLLLFGLVLSVGFGLLLVYFVRREGPRSSDIDWDSAEQIARRDDTDRDGEPGAGPDRDGSGDADRPDTEW